MGNNRGKLDRSINKKSLNLLSRTIVKRKTKVLIW